MIRLVDKGREGEGLGKSTSFKLFGPGSIPDAFPTVEEGQILLLHGVKVRPDSNVRGLDDSMQSYVGRIIQRRISKSRIQS